MTHHRQLIQRFIRWLAHISRKAPSSRTIEAHTAPIRLPSSYQDAAARLVNWDTIKGASHRNKLVKTSRAGSSPEIIEFYRAFSKELQRRGMPFFAFEFYRSDQRQARLYGQGVTKAGPGASPHNWGYAVDIVHSEQFWDISQRQWDVIGAIGKEVARRRKIAIEWGGDWSFYDPAHWQLADWKSLRDAENEMRADGFEMPSEDTAKFRAIRAHQKDRKNAA